MILDAVLLLGNALLLLIRVLNQEDNSNFEKFVSILNFIGIVLMTLLLCGYAR